MTFKGTGVVGFFVLLVFLACSSDNVIACENYASVEVNNPDINVEESVLAALARAGLTRDDFFRTLRLVSKYETGGCWAGATGNSDGQLVSVGVMQWNFGQGTLQPLIKRFSEKYSSNEHFESIRDQLMPRYGKQFFDIGCRVKPVKASCAEFLKTNRDQRTQVLHADFKNELDQLFNDPVMRQLQVDYFGRAITSVLSDLDRIYETPRPAPWQVAWAVDVKTQQGDKFPKNKNIKKIREQTETLAVDERKRRLNGIVMWYGGLCDSGTSEGIKYDCTYNVNTWPTMFSGTLADLARERTVHFSHLIARTAQNTDGAYQADSFQRRAAIAFGRGSVHQKIYDFTLP